MVRKILILVSVASLLAGCANWLFERKFRPLLERDHKLNSEYIDFEDSLPNDKHWSANVATLNRIVEGKERILTELKSITPTEDYAEVYQALIEDISNNIEYLKKEAKLIEASTEYGMWLAQSLMREAIAHGLSSVALPKAKEEVLKLQEELTALADRCNASQAKMANLVAAKRLLPSYRQIRYTKYMKGYVGYRIK